MIFSSKFLSSFSLSEFYSFFQYLHYRQTKTSSGNGENIQPRFRSPRRDPFFDPLPPCLGRDPYFGNLWAKILVVKVDRACNALAISKRHPMAYSDAPFGKFCTRAEHLSSNC